MRAGQREVRRYSVMGLMTTYLITLLGKLGLIRSAVVIKIQVNELSTGNLPSLDFPVYFKENKYSSLCGKFLPKAGNILLVCFFPEYLSPPFLKTIFTKSSLQELIGNQQRFSMHTFRLEEETCSPWEEMTSSCTESTFETDTCKSKPDSPAKSTVLISQKKFQKGNLVLFFLQ